MTNARLSLLRELAQGDLQTTRDRNALADALVEAGFASVTSGQYGAKKVMTYVYSLTPAGTAALAEAGGGRG